MQLIPQHLPEGDSSKERTVRVTGDKKQIEVAKEMIKEVISQVLIIVFFVNWIFSLDLCCMSNFLLILCGIMQVLVIMMTVSSHKLLIKGMLCLVEDWFIVYWLVERSTLKMESDYFFHLYILSKGCLASWYGFI